MSLTLQVSRGKSPLQDSSQMVKGMRGFVKHTLSLGFDSQRLQLQQQIVLDEKGEALPSVKLMQENARLIVLTKEVREGLHSKILHHENAVSLRSVFLSAYLLEIEIVCQCFAQAL